MYIYPLEHLNRSSLNKVPSFPFSGKTLEYEGKVVNDSALLCLSGVEPEREEIREKLRSKVFISLAL